MKSILERAFVHLLNEEHDKATDLFRKAVLERARAIHESLRESDDSELDDMDGDDLSEEFFTEADLDDAEAADKLSDDLDDSGDMTGDMGDADASDMDADASDMDADASDMDADASDMDAVDSDVDAGMDDGSDDGDISDKLSDIEDEISALQAEFEKIMAEFGNDGDDADMGDDADGADVDVTVTSDGDSDADFGDEDYDDISESMVDDLKKVAAITTPGMGANGKKLAGDQKSPLDSTKEPRSVPTTDGIDRGDAGTHGDFKLETAPSVKSMKKFANNRSSGKEGRPLVDKTGPKGAQLAKPVSTSSTKSPLGNKQK